MEKYTVKQLQKKCKEAGLRVTGNKQTLIDRLEYRSAQTTLNEELFNRVRELENTLARIQAQSGSESDGEASANIESSPRTANFQPAMISSPRPPAMITSLSQGVATVQAPIASTAAFTPYVYQQQYSQTVPIPMFNPTRGITLSTSSNNQAVGGSQQYQPLPYPSVGPIPSSAGHNTQVVGAPYYPAPTYYATGSPFTNIKDIVSVLPESNPISEDSLTSLQFVQRVQLLKNAYQWRDDLVVFAVQQKLSGHAKMWSES